MLRVALLLLLLSPQDLWAAGTGPPVNSDLGCTSSGQGLSYDGSNMVCQAPTRPLSAIGSLPTCNTAATGKMYMVTDALAPTALATIVAGGAIKIGVICNGTNWIVQ